MCPPCVRFGRASKPCPPSLPFVFPPPGPHPQALSLSALCLSAFMAGLALPNLVCHVSALCVLWHVSGVRLALYLPYVSFGRASERCVSHVALCARHVSGPCVFFVLSLYARGSLFILSLSVFWPGLWLGFGRAFVSSVSPFWFLRLCLFCVRCCRP